MKNRFKVPRYVGSIKIKIDLMNLFDSPCLKLMLCYANDRESIQRSHVEKINVYIIHTIGRGKSHMQTNLRLFSVSM